MIGIYKITSPSGKTYIGQSIDIDNRWKRYYKRLKCKKQPKLFNSLNKYGFENHIFEIIEECLESELEQKETHHKQLELDKVGGDWLKVLFCHLIDGKGGHKSEETKRKMRKPRSEETKLKMSKMRKGIPKPTGYGIKVSLRFLGKKQSIETCINKSKALKGRIFSKEHKEKISKSQKGKLKPKPITFGLRLEKPINQYDLNGNFIKEWESAKKAVINLKGKYTCSITDCCIGRQKTAYGYIWKYKN